MMVFEQKSHKDSDRAKAMPENCYRRLGPKGFVGIVEVN